MSAGHYTFILASKRRGALYIETTSDLPTRVLEHKHNLVEGLTSLYAIHQLVYYECFDSAGPSLSRQAQLERLPRILKLHLVETRNPDWRDLYDDLAVAGAIPS